MASDPLLASYGVSQHMPCVKKQQPAWVDELSGAEGKRLIANVARWMGRSQDADDLAQEVFLRLLRMKDQTSIRETRAFAFRVASNVLKEWHSLARNRYKHTNDDLEEFPEQDDNLGRVFSQQRMKRLEEALSTLSPKCRAVVLLIRRDDLSREEVAQRMGISVGMVKKYLSHGVEVCERYFNDPDYHDVDAAGP